MGFCFHNTSMFSNKLILKYCYFLLLWWFNLWHNEDIMFCHHSFSSLRPLSLWLSELGFIPLTPGPRGSWSLKTALHIEVLNLPLPVRGRRRKKRDPPTPLPGMFWALLSSTGHVNPYCVKWHLGKHWHICSFLEFYSENAAQSKC